MRCSLRRLTSAVSLLCLILSQAFPLTYGDLEGILKEKLRELYGDRVKIKGITVYARKLPEVKEASVSLLIKQGNPRGRALITVHERGRVKVITVGLDLLWRCRVLVSSEDMRAGERAYPWVFEEKMIYMDRCPEGIPERNELINYTLTRDLPKGGVLKKTHLRKAPLVKFGEDVRITFRRGNLEITTLGRVLETGFYGDTVRVRVGSTGKVIRARVVGEGEVAVEGFY